MNEYTVMLYREPLRAKVVEAGHLPPVVPVVLYNGESRWTAERGVRDLIVRTSEYLAKFQPSHRYLLLDLRRAKADYADKLTSAVARLEQISTGKDLVEVAAFLAASLAGPGHEAPSTGERLNGAAIQVCNIDTNAGRQKQRCGRWWSGRWTRGRGRR